MSLNNFRASGSILTKLFQTTWREVGVITRVQLLEGLPPKIWKGQKTSKFRRDFWQLSTLIVNISGTDRHIEHVKKISSTTTPSTLAKENWWTLVHEQKSSNGSNPNWHFSGDYIHFGHYAVLPSRIFTRVTDWPGYLAHPPTCTGVPPAQKKH